MSYKSGTKFRSRKIDNKRPLAVYRSSELQDLNELTNLSRAAPMVATGVEKEEEEEYHLQNALHSTQSGVAHHTTFIPTPDASKLINNYSDFYKNPFHQPKSLIRHSIPMEEAIGCLYNMDEQDDIFFAEYMKELKEGKIKEESKITEDQFEEVMHALETLTNQKFGDDLSTLEELQEYMNTQLHPPPSACYHYIYEYWKKRRLQRNKKPIQPYLKTEELKIDSDPYVCFRRREIKTLRKTRRCDALSLEKLKRLQNEMEQAHQLMEMVCKREKLRRDSLLLEHKIFEQKILIRQMKKKLGVVSSEKIQNENDNSILPLSENKNGYKTNNVNGNSGISINVPGTQANINNLNNVGHTGHTRVRKKMRKSHHFTGDESNAKRLTIPKIKIRQSSVLHTDEMVRSASEKAAQAEINSRNAKRTEEEKAGWIDLMDLPDPTEDLPFTHQGNSYYQSDLPLSIDYKTFSLRSSKHLPFARRRIGRGGRIIFDRRVSLQKIREIKKLHKHSIGLLGHPGSYEGRFQSHSGKGKTKPKLPWLKNAYPQRRESVDYQWFDECSDLDDFESEEEIREDTNTLAYNAGIYNEADQMVLQIKPAFPEQFNPQYRSLSVVTPGSSITSISNNKTNINPSTSLFNSQVNSSLSQNQPSSTSQTPHMIATPTHPQASLTPKNPKIGNPNITPGSVTTISTPTLATKTTSTLLVNGHISPVSKISGIETPNNLPSNMPSTVFDPTTSILQSSISNKTHITTPVMTTGSPAMKVNGVVGNTLKQQTSVSNTKFNPTAVNTQSSPNSISIKTIPTGLAANTLYATNAAIASTITSTNKPSTPSAASSTSNKTMGNLMSSTNTKTIVSPKVIATMNPITAATLKNGNIKSMNVNTINTINGVNPLNAMNAINPINTMNKMKLAQGYATSPVSEASINLEGLKNQAYLTQATKNQRLSSPYNAAKNSALNPYGLAGANANVLANAKMNSYYNNTLKGNTTATTQANTLTINGKTGINVQGNTTTVTAGSFNLAANQIKAVNDSQKVQTTQAQTVKTTTVKTSTTSSTVPTTTTSTPTNATSTAITSKATVSSTVSQTPTLPASLQPTAAAASTTTTPLMKPKTASPLTTVNTTNATELALTSSPRTTPGSVKSTARKTIRKDTPTINAATLKSAQSTPKSKATVEDPKSLNIRQIMQAQAAQAQTQEYAQTKLKQRLQQTIGTETTAASHLHSVSSTSTTQGTTTTTTGIVNPAAVGVINNQTAATTAINVNSANAINISNLSTGAVDINAAAAAQSSPMISTANSHISQNIKNVLLNSQQANLIHEGNINSFAGSGLSPQKNISNLALVNNIAAQRQQQQNKLLMTAAAANQSVVGLSQANLLQNQSIQQQQLRMLRLQQIRGVVPNATAMGTNITLQQQQALLYRQQQQQQQQQLLSVLQRQNNMVGMPAMPMMVGPNGLTKGVAANGSPPRQYVQPGFLPQYQQTQQQRNLMMMQQQIKMMNNKQLAEQVNGGLGNNAALMMGFNGLSAVPNANQILINQQRAGLPVNGLLSTKEDLAKAAALSETKKL
ncbi:hypothetical protein BCR36DRAFT_342692 [Piromyces finnis]|uniref:Enhancer of polycomb-like protein n=1 Tax=Piromyces finnis TaxID=1754191 RepID=A0A1Y1VMQ7_9FUNG|nr:hypothetical protein BCR36DRAFT_342692 [Piromyces finnis]|eukprot:ORX60206.1 hypothetical protein BCR36DRAFT_342692 [Piromyces finnis]